MLLERLWLEIKGSVLLKFPAGSREGGYLDPLKLTLDHMFSTDHSWHQCHNVDHSSLYFFSSEIIPDRQQLIAEETFDLNIYQLSQHDWMRMPLIMRSSQNVWLAVHECMDYQQSKKAQPVEIPQDHEKLRILEFQTEDKGTALFQSIRGVQVLRSEGGKTNIPAESVSTGLWSRSATLAAIPGLHGSVIMRMNTSFESQPNSRCVRLLQFNHEGWTKAIRQFKEWVNENLNDEWRSRAHQPQYCFANFKDSSAQTFASPILREVLELEALQIVVLDKFPKLLPNMTSAAALARLQHPYLWMDFSRPGILNLWWVS
jgi:hypothetical protein